MKTAIDTMLRSSSFDEWADDAWPNYLASLHHKRDARVALSSKNPARVVEDVI